MSEHPKQHEKNTILVSKVKRAGRFDYVPNNQTAQDFADGYKQASFNADDLKFLKSMCYCVLILDTGSIEYREIDETDVVLHPRLKKKA